MKTQKCTETSCLDKNIWAWDNEINDWMCMYDDGCSKKRETILAESVTLWEWFDSSNYSCPECGNGVIEQGEICDAPALNHTCASLGFRGGQIACSDNCKSLNTTGCHGCVNISTIGQSCDPDGSSCNGECQLLPHQLLFSSDAAENDIFGFALQIAVSDSSSSHKCRESCNLSRFLH